jgi:hypothetical protein
MLIPYRTRMKPLLTKRLLAAIPPGRSATAAPSGMSNGEAQGIYYNQGYGPLTLCAAHSFPSHTAVDDKCRHILSAQPFEADQLSEVSSYVGHYDGSNTMYLRFSHINGSSYGVSLGQAFPKTSSGLSAMYGAWEAAISAKGIGYTGNAWGTGSGVAERLIDRDDLQGTAEVWFDRMDLSVQ